MGFDFERAQAIVEEKIKALPLTGQPDDLYAPIRYMLSIGGKRMRPVLTLLGCYLYNDGYQKAMNPAIAVEIFHNFTLLHDDLMDNAPLRRGQTTVHEQWNNNVAILSGDVMLVKAYEVLMETEDPRLATMIKLFNRCACEVCEGQQYDMNFETERQIGVEDYIEMIRLKTAVLLGTSLQIGALSGGASLEESEKVYAFGMNLGIGFQLKDDLLDVYGEQKKFGKQVGGDIIANKKTFLLIKALEKAEGALDEELHHWLNMDKFNPAEKVERVTAIYNQLNIKALTEAKMNSFFEKAFEEAEKIQLPLEKRDVLLSFADRIIKRDK